VFASRDYDSATVDDIAAAAELSKGTIYLYFQNKADLFVSTIEMGMEEFNSIIREIISSNADPAVGLPKMIKSLLIHCEENADFFKILSSDQAHFEIHNQITDNPSFKERIIAVASQDIDTIAGYIQHGIEMGVFRKVDPRDAAFAIVSIIRGFSFRQVMDPTVVKLSEKAETIATILLDGLKRAKSATE